MISFDEPKDPDVAKTYRFDWADRVGETTISAATAAIVSGGGTVDSTSFGDDYVDVKLSGGTHGTPIAVQVDVTYANADTDEETGLISILSSGYQKTDLELSEDALAKLKEARTNRLVNGAVRQVRRGDRVLIYDNASLSDIDAAISRVERDIEDAKAVAAGRTTRSAITPVWID